jgi:predicted alpha/beta superfamily hydrolase
VKSRISFCFIALLVALFWACSLHAQAPKAVEIPGTQLLKITSTILQEDFSLLVQLPRFYEDTTRVFPVIYLLDGQWDFPLVNGQTGGQYYDGFIPEVIVVGIAWTGEHPNYDSLRQKDLTPTKIQPIPHSGHGPEFLSFIKKEVMPFIESKYRASKTDRTLIGSSLGGLFTLYTLFHETTLFNRYILTSPALQWDNGTIYAAESTYAANNSRLPVKLFMAIGGYEGVAEFEKFAARLKGRNYKDLTLETRVLEGMGHSGSKPEGYTRGLQSVYARPTLALDPRILDEYAGTYEPMPGLRVKLANENGKLVGDAPGSDRLTFEAQTETDFYLKGSYLFLHFKKDSAGKVTGFQMDTFSGGGFVKKEKE